MRAKKSKVERRKSKALSLSPARLPAPSAQTVPLLVEIGCEEIPARFLEQAEADFGRRLLESLASLGVARSEQSQKLKVEGQETLTLQPSHFTLYSTPRRLVAHVSGVLSRQPDRAEEITGPPVKVAFDGEGKPTRAAESFAQKNGVSIDALVRVTTPKGEYVAARKTIRGRMAFELLAEALPGIVTGISFQKSMYWGAKSGPRFVRPIRWIVALLGEGKGAKVIPFEVAGVRSSDRTYGHRLAVIPAKAGTRKPSQVAGSIQVTGFADYCKKLAAAEVEIDPEKRREMVRTKSKALLEASERLVEDAELETWHVNSTEWPSAIAGDFDHRFLSLPREILITVMRDHQKYFAVEARDGGIRPRFIAILNRRGSDPKRVIRAGHERVLRARFTDAQFFWTADQKIPLRDRLPLLEKVTYHEKLGSYADKVRRMESIVKEICAALEGQGKLGAEDRAHVLRAVGLCKCDLITQMVQEFTELQGVVGGLYAKAQGEPQEVAEAIYDHYLPQGAEDKLPRTTIGAVVSLADKLDTVVAGFRAGLEPSGSSDPFGLRRAANGILRIIIECGLKLRLGDLAVRFDRAIEEHRLGVMPKIPRSQAVPSVLKFLDERLDFYLRETTKLRYDTVRAIFASRPTVTFAGISFQEIDPNEALRCACALDSARDSEDFQALASAAKRARNILTKSAQAQDLQMAGARVDEARLQEDPERELYAAYLNLAEGLKSTEGKGDYEAGFRAMAKIRPQVDRFFDKVLVMADDVELRRNRLGLLMALNKDVFSRFADLSLIESSTLTSVGASTRTVESDK